MLELAGLSGGYRDARVVNDLDLRIRPGEVVGLLGRNGVGKTTLLKTVFGLCRLFSGEVRVDGRAVRPGRPELLARAGFSLMPDDRGVFPSLTVEQNLRLAARRDYDPPVDVRSVYPLLADRADQLAGTLSGGQKQQLGLARAMLAGSRLIAVDEFSQGLQPSVVDESLTALQALAASGVAVLVVEQGPEIPLRFCDRILVMVKGGIVLDASAADLRADPSRLTDLLVVG
ncbi:ABC transporter ATP-binding protein [Blastococcus tunisiensis]|uniref:Amino acid/amide ABC transporter ATP-binding protein 2, HAAT family n=1 Tax=Blastococcus tunisiensis TaxID=1798228 RepID=A0A1I2EDN8_9ACTN|nr:ATP-binding cassette domain-containing protein [Blastococcus sp. DSM 46838]SFE91164.1 amino acid/amide ABC transporter ATP-binding protein 2, HAAT family [Blastococcus sp. DSM 46838]